MENTARKLSVDVVNEFKEAHGSLDLLKVFLITGATDISKSYELVTKWHKDAGTAEDKANFLQAKKMLQQIELKRIELTTKMYGIDIPNIPTEEESKSDEPVAKTILMLPSIDEIMVRTKKIIVDGKGSNESISEALAILKETAGQGKVKDAGGTPITWDNDKINQYLSEIENELNPEEKKIGFKTLQNHIVDMAKAGKTIDEIKDIARKMILGKILTTEQGGETYITSESIFDDYWTRGLVALVECAIRENNKSADSVVSKQDQATGKIETEVKPFLENLDKNEKESSFSKVTKKIREIYTNLGINKSLQDALLEAKELAKTWAPNLLARYQTSTTNTKPLDKTNAVVVVDPTPEIYDDNHNVKESNKELWAEVENYTMLNDIYVKSIALVKDNKWQDALSMAILLISSGKIKEIADSKDPLQWTSDQVKEWFHKIVIPTADNSIQGPVPQQGFTEPAAEKKTEDSAAATEDKVTEKVARLLRNPEQWKDKYKFKTASVNIEHHNDKLLTFEVVDATSEQEPELLITETNFTKFIDSQRDVLVANGNRVKEVRKAIMDKLSPFYEITHSECKSICGALSKEAGDIRREARKAGKSETQTVVTEPETNVQSENTASSEEADNDDVFYDKFEVGQEIREMRGGKEVVMKDQEFIMDYPDHEGKECAVVVKDGKILSITPIQAENTSTQNPQNASNQSQDATQSPKDQKTTTPTEKSAGEEHTNSNSKEFAYKGFEEIVSATKGVQFDKAIYAKITSYSDVAEGKKAVFEIIDRLRKDSHYKKAYARNYKNSQKVDILAMIEKVVTTGNAINKK